MGGSTTRRRAWWWWAGAPELHTRHKARLSPRSHNACSMIRNSRDEGSPRQRDQGDQKLHGTSLWGAGAARGGTAAVRRRY